MKLSIVLTVFTALNSLLGFIVQALLAKEFGAGIEVDLYFFSLSYPIFISALVASFISYSLVPKLASFPNDSKEKDSYLSSNLMFVLLVILIVSVSVPYLVQCQISSFENDLSLVNKKLLKDLVTVSWYIALLQVIQGFMISAFNAYHRPVIAVSMASLTYLGMLTGLFFISLYGVLSVSVGMLFGVACSIFLSLVLFRKRISINFKLRDIRTQFSNSFYYVLALSCFSSHAAIDSYWASQSGEGILAQLSYAQRVLIAIGNLAVAAPSALLVPRFSELLQQKCLEDNIKFFTKSLALVALFTFLVMSSMYILSDSIVYILFQRGAFGEADTLAVAEIIRILSIGGFFMLISVIFFRLLFAVQGTERALCAIGVSWTIQYFLFSKFFYHNGGASIAVGYSISWVITFLFLLGYSISAIRKA